MNLVVLVGNLTRDPEVRYTGTGMAVAHINIAVNRFSKKEGAPDSDFFRVTVFGKQAETVEKYLSKGKKVGIEGVIQNDNYEKEGQKIYRDTIIANRIEFLSPKGEGGGGFPSGGFPGDTPFGDDPFANSGQGGGNAASPGAVPPGLNPIDSGLLDDDDLPF